MTRPGAPVLRFGPRRDAALLVLAASLGCSQDPPFAAYGAGLDALIVDVNGDGTDDVVLPGSELTAVDGVAFEAVWSRPNNSGQRVATRKFLVLAEDRALTIAALADGASVGSVPLSDRVESLTVDGEAVWVRTIDGVVGKLDPAARALDTKAGPPPAAPGCGAGGRAVCEPLADGDFRLRDGSLAVRFEYKKQGTRELTVVGEDGGATTFTRVVDPNGRGLSGFDLVGGVLYLGLADQVLALDVRGGATVFDLVGRPLGLRVGSGRLYVETSELKTYRALEVLDARTGAPLFVFGRPLAPLRPR